MRLKSERLVGPVRKDKDGSILPAILAPSQAVSLEGVGRGGASLPLEPHAINGALPARKPVTVITGVASLGAAASLLPGNHLNLLFVPGVWNSWNI